MLVFSTEYVLMAYALYCLRIFFNLYPPTRLYPFIPSCSYVAPALLPPFFIASPILLLLTVEVRRKEEWMWKLNLAGNITHAQEAKAMHPYLLLLSNITLVKENAYSSTPSLALRKVQWCEWILDPYSVEPSPYNVLPVASSAKGESAESRGKRKEEENVVSFLCFLCCSKK